MIESIYDTENFRKEGHQLIDFLADYLEKAKKGEEMKVLPLLPPETTYNFWKNYDLKDEFQFYQDLVDRSNHLHHPGYIGHQVSPPIPNTAFSMLIAALLKNGTGVIEMAPAGVAIERIVTEEMAKYIGYSEKASGIITSGGTLANLTAMLCARQEKGKGDIWNDGLATNKNMAIMVSEAAHYCIDRAARIMGLGADGVIKVPMNSRYQIEVDQLEISYQEAIAVGKQVFAIVGNACSTATGAYDDLKAMGTFARKYNLWFHVDGAHGGPVIFSQKYKHLVDGIEQADSVVIDFHKMMFTAGLSTTVIYKNGNDSYKTFQVKAQYLFDDNQQEEWYNMAKRTFECTKFMNALTVYLLLKKYGSTLFESLIDLTYDLSKTFYTLLQEDLQFETISSPESNIVCFRYFDVDLSQEKLNLINKNTRQQLINNGNFYIVQTTLNDQLFLRVSIMNPLTTIDHLKELLKEIKSINK